MNFLFEINLILTVMELPKNNLLILQSVKDDVLKFGKNLSNYLGVQRLCTGTAEQFVKVDKSFEFKT